MTAADSESVVNQFIAALMRADVDEIADFFTEEGIYHPLPMPAAVGKAAIRKDAL